MALNVWSEIEVKRAERIWGQSRPEFLLSMYRFIIDDKIDSVLDLGCGFGRFAEYIRGLPIPPTYTGYDSSPDMISRLVGRFPEYTDKVHLRQITSPFIHTSDGIICAAVLIHLPITAQDLILQNVFENRPSKFTFDINSPSEFWLRKNDSFEKVIKGTEHTFRMTWQSHYDMTRKIMGMFLGYSLKIEFYKLDGNRHKVIYKLEKEQG